MTSNVATIPQPSIMAAMAERYGMRPDAFEATLRATVIPSNASREEVAAFLLIAKEYGLNPITREIYAYPRRGGGIQPIVGVDGWSHIINDHPSFDGMDFVDTVEKGVVTAVTCRMWRKDRGHPIEATEYLAECFQSNSAAWSKWPRRMLRHKAMIQAARYCFGYSGIIDPDEAARFVDTREKQVERSASLDQRLTRLVQPPRLPGEPKPTPQPIPPQPDDDDEGGWDDDDQDHGPDEDEPAEPYDTTEEKHLDDIEDERARLTEVARSKALEGSRKLRAWRSRLRPEQVALLDWEPLEEAAKAVGALPPREEEAT